MERRTRQQLIDWCRLDRDLLLGQLRKRYSYSKSVEQPAEVLDDILVEMLNFNVITAPLPVGQLALCDFDAQRVTINSRMAEFVHPKTDLKALINSTKAHELGHIRLHEHELSMDIDRCSEYLPFPEPGWIPAPRCLVTYRDKERERLSAVDRMREQEADLYASTFLVPEMALLTLPPTLLIRKAVNEGRDFSVKYLWSLIYQLARWFRVSPTLMKYRLMGLGLVGETQGSIHVSRQLAFRGAVSW